MIGVKLGLKTSKKKLQIFSSSPYITYKFKAKTLHKKNKGEG